MIAEIKVNESIAKAEAYIDTNQESKKKVKILTQFLNFNSIPGLVWILLGGLQGKYKKSRNHIIHFFGRYIKILPTANHIEYTGSHPITEIKQC